jgi:hypothetical protein
MTDNFWKPIGSLTKADLETLMGRPERTVLDYKQAQNPSHINPDALGDDLCAFANTGLGRMVFGAEEGDRDDLARLPGVPNADIGKLRSKIRNASHAVQPPVEVDVQDVPLTKDASALVVEIRPTPGREPHQFKGRYLMRSADGNTAMLHSSVVRAVIATSDAPQKVLGPPDSGFGYIHPFGAESGSGWFFGLQLEFAHAPVEPIFEVFDELGERIRSIVTTRIAENVRPVIVELDRIFADREHSSGTASKTRFQVETDGTLSEFDRLRDGGSLNVMELLEGSARERLLVLAKLASEIAPGGWFRSAVSIWGTSATELQLMWPDGKGQLNNHATVTVRSRRHHFPSELTDPASRVAGELLWRFDNHLRIHSKAPVGAPRPWR